ncbi:MAG: dihydroxy-acid dehydratase [Candidatus Sumerlaeota bacterium]|nr:dihydroxy-acid dehydratase [Candidatus Sumerlaeota bacterium]
MRSDIIKIGAERAPHRSLLRATGVRDEDMNKPFIAIVNSHVDIIPGHVHLKEVGDYIKQCVREAGGMPFVFNTIGIDDGIAMGHMGMKYSLPSREIIADSVESMIRAHCFDAMICIPNCDKIVPGMLMAAMRCNIPAIFVSGGPMEAGRGPDGKVYDLISVFEGVGGLQTGTVSEADLIKMENLSCPTCGSCSGMFTANSMNCLGEALGMALPGNGTILATSDERLRLYRRAAFQIMELLRRDIKPRDIATLEAFDNAMILDMAMGGSTNTLLHSLAIAREAGIEYSVGRVNDLAHKTPNICKVSPSSKYHVEDVARAGGIHTILWEVMRAKPGLLTESCITVTGETLGENIRKFSVRSPDCVRLTHEITGIGDTPTGRTSAQVMAMLDSEARKKKAALERDDIAVPVANSADPPDAFKVVGPVTEKSVHGIDLYDCIRTVDNAYSQSGGLSILYGNLALYGAVVKTAGVDPNMLVHSGPAVIFESQEDSCKGILAGRVKPGDVVIIRNEGPRGGPGMQEMLAPTSYIKGMGLGDKCALVTDGRFSGGTAGACIGHVSPEAANGGLIGLLHDGDIIEIDIPKNKLVARLTEDEIAARRTELEAAGGWKSSLPEELRRGCLGKYAAMATSADTGGVLKWE